MAYVTDPTLAALRAAMIGGVAPPITTSGTSSGAPAPLAPAPVARAGYGTAAPITASRTGGDLDAILAQMQARTTAQQAMDTTPRTPFDQLRQLNEQIASGQQFGGEWGRLLSNPQSVALLQQRLQTAGIADLLRKQGLQIDFNQTPFPFQPFGTASIGGMDSITAGAPPSGVLGDTTPSNDPGDPASHPSSGIIGDQSQAQGVISGSSGILGSGFSPSESGLIGHSDAQSQGTQGVTIGVTADGQTVSVNADGVVSVGGQAVGVATGGGGGGLGGGGGSGFGDGGFGGGMDGSSNAGIGGPAGTGVARGIGAAAGEGAGTGGVGEGEQFGNQFTVRGRGGVDSQPVRFMATPGELVTITPPGDPKNRALGDVLRIMSMRRGG